MKILLTILLLISAELHSQWINQPSPTGFQLFGCHFPNTDTGYIAGYGNTILKTTNGGINWIDRSLPTTAENNLALWFINGNTGFLCSSRDTLLYTTNGGLNWENHFYCNSQSDRIFFINSQTGWFTSNKLYKTTNSGINWFMISNQSAPDFIFINENTGWKTKYNGAGNSELLKTTDGGVNWSVIYSTGSFRILYSISFINENTGWVCGYRGFISKTTDGGANWTVQRNAETEAYYCIKFLNENTGWSAGDNNVVIKTTNGGNDWMYSDLTASRFEDMYFVNANTGWMIGSFGRIYKTNNNGGLTEINTGANNLRGFRLSQNYPNPFNPATVINYEIPSNVKSEKSKVKLVIFNNLGKEVRTLVNETLNAGNYEVKFDGSNLPSGIYFYRLVVSSSNPLTAGEFSETKQMILLK